MDQLWSPWRYNFISKGQPSGGCVFCQIAAHNADNDDATHFVLRRARFNFIILNLYPYTSGHLMVVPYAHLATLENAPEETAAEMFRLTREAERRLRKVYKPEGINIGMNIGACAGAGIAGHIHMHALPRWLGDANFMSVIGETRVLPETLETTYRKLLAAFEDSENSIPER
ncbi:MAG: HIT domain-containing protein [Acidobacteriota bacterium]|nr:HIT domain-containing protein [Acidobacteriota bacterium]